MRYFGRLNIFWGWGWWCEDILGRRVRYLGVVLYFWGFLFINNFTFILCFGFIGFIGIWIFGFFILEVFCLGSFF